MVDGSSRETSSPAVVGAETVVETETSTTLTGDDGADDLPSTIATSALATRTASGVAGWSMASSLSEPAWCGPAGPGRSLPPSPSLVFFSGGVAAAGCDGGVGGGRRGNRRGDVAPLAPGSAARAPAVGGGCALGSGRGGGLVVLRGGGLGAGRGRVVGRSRRGCVRRRVSGGLLVSRAFGFLPATRGIPATRPRAWASDRRRRRRAWVS